MRISFQLPASTAALLHMAAERNGIATGKPLTPSEIAKALVQEVLIDDATMHGLTPGVESVN